jgi:hypothetical protein
MGDNQEIVPLLNQVEQEDKDPVISKPKSLGFLSGIRSTVGRAIDSAASIVTPAVENIKTSAVKIGNKVSGTFKDSGKRIYKTVNKTLKVFRKPFTSLKELGTIIVNEITQKQLQDIKAGFLTVTLDQRSKQPQDVAFTQKYGTRPTLVLPVAHMVNVAVTGIKQTNANYIGITFTDNVSKGVTGAAGITAGLTLATTGAGMVMPPLLCIPVIVCFAAFLQFQREKNKELLYASELIFSMCQDMLPDLIRMYNFYTKVNKVNPFIAKTIKKVTDLQVYIISLCDPIVIEFMALSFGIIDNFDERYDRGFGDDKLKKIFGVKGFTDKCHLSEDERTKIGEDGAEMKKSDDDCDGNSSERSFASVKRAIIARLTRFHVTRQATNFFASSEKYRQAIRDITIVGILFSQASARFSLDAIEYVSELKEAKTEFDNSVDKTNTETLNEISVYQRDTVTDQIHIIDTAENNDETVSTDSVTSISDGSTGGRRRKRTRKYRR